MATYLTLTGVEAVSGGTLNLNGANTGMASITLLPGWRPRIAPRRQGTIGNKPIHEDVTENLPLRIHGESEAACITALEALAAAVEQARAWRRSPYAVTALNINYKVNGSTLTNPLLAAILDTPAKAADLLELPVSFNRDIQVYEVNPVRLPLLRRGGWLGDEEEQTASTVESSRLMSITFTETAVLPSPVELDCTIEDSDIFASGLAVPNSFLLVAQRNAAGQAGILLQNAATAPIPTNFSSVADPGTQSNSGNVLRFTPPDTDTYGKLSFSAFGIDTNARLFALYVNIRSSISAVTWYIRGAVGLGNLVPQADRRTIPIVVEGADILQPGWYFLGLVNYPRNINTFGFDVAASTTTGSPVLDFERIAIQAVDSPGSTAIALNALTIGAGFTNNPNLVIDPRFLTRPLPEMVLDSIRPSYAGNLTPQISGTRFDMAWLATSGTNWRWYDANAASIISHTLTATRRPAYLIPR